MHFINCVNTSYVIINNLIDYIINIRNNNKFITYLLPIYY